MDHRDNEKNAGYSDITEISTPGSNPSSGVLRIYAKSDDSLYALNSSGAEVKIGTGSGGLSFGFLPDGGLNIPFL